MDKRMRVVLWSATVGLIGLLAAFSDIGDHAAAASVRIPLLGSRGVESLGNRLVSGAASAQFMLVAAAAVGVAFMAVGCTADTRRPSRLTGLLLAISGPLWLLGQLRLSTNPVLFTIGLLCTNFYIAPLFQLLYLFPSGRPKRKVGTYGLVVLYIYVFVADWLDWAFYQPQDHGVPSPHEYLTIKDDPRLFHDVTNVTSICDGILIVAGFIVTVMLWRSGTQSWRRSFAPFGAAALLKAASAVAFESVLVPPGVWLRWVPTTTTVVIPLAVEIGMMISLRTQVRMTTSIVTELSDERIAADLQATLRRVLGDRSVDVGVWDSERQCFVDSEGKVVEPPPVGGRRIATPVRGGDSRPLALLVHDNVLTDEPELLDALGAAVRLALELRRVGDGLTDGLVDIRQLLAKAAASERRRVQRDIHDGVQTRLVTALLCLREAQENLGASEVPDVGVLLVQAGQEVEDAIAELRQLVRGAPPARLRSEGLPRALSRIADRTTGLRVLIDRVPRQRLDPVVEQAVYFVASEAVTNAVKHSRAKEVRISVRVVRDQVEVTVDDDGLGGAVPRIGGGIAGLQERVAEMGGRLSVTSPLGEGTRIVGLIPSTSGTASPQSSTSSPVT
ncbi:MAG TPA: sensor histidine kinase [Mycobacteriales bacterium]|nr:sensor histidine kinase [Mycobacteriales bacterium]